MTLEIGLNAPLFALQSDEGAEIALLDLKGKNVLLYFVHKLFFLILH